MQCGPSDIKCGCNVDPPHLHILNVDVMWEGLDEGGVWYSLFIKNFAHYSFHLILGYSLK